MSKEIKDTKDIVIRNHEELKEYRNETNDLLYPDSDIRIEYQTNENEINDIDCMNLFLCTWENGVVDERFDFVGRDVHCWGTFIVKDFLGRCFDGGNFVGRDFNGRNAICWNMEGRKIWYHAVFIAYHAFRCSEIYGRLENSIHKCLNENIEYIDKKDFVYGVYSVF